MPRQVNTDCAYDAPQDKLALMPNYYRWIARHFLPYLRGDVLEVGAGGGHFIDTYRHQVQHVAAVDYNPTLLERLRGRYANLNLDAIHCDLRGDCSVLPDSTFDAFIALDVLEHMEDDAESVAKLGRKLRSGGVACIKVPADSSMYSPMDEASGHFRRYDPATLERLFTGCGFTTLQLRAMNKPGAMAYRRRRQKRSNFSTTFNNRTLKAINAALWVMPYVDALLPGSKGLSLVGVFQKG